MTHTTLAELPVPLGGAGVENNTDRRSRSACWQDDYLFRAFEFRQLIVKPCADVADLSAAIAGGLLVTAGTGAAIAHQVHGAMGFTHEHSLHHATRRLWSWREEFGNEAVWAARLGKMVTRHGADGLWPFITAGS